MSWLSATDALSLATLLPLAAFFVLLFFGRRFGRQGSAAGGISMGVSVTSFGLALLALVVWVARPGFNQPNYVEAFTHPWIAFSTQPAARGAVASNLAAAPGQQALTVGCLVDSLTIAMFVVFTLLPLFVHLFAMGSLQRISGRHRFYAMLQLFQFALLAIFLANSLVMILVFAMVLSFAGFLMLARFSARQAGIRILFIQLFGDTGLLLALGILLGHTHALAGLALFDAQGSSILGATVRQALGVLPSEYLLFTGAGFLDMHWLTWAGIGFMVFALARMAQFPLQVWAPQAAEAPAPVSATLLSASSLAVGIYVLARVHPILTLDTRLIAAILGAVTLTLGALVSLAQSDLRKVLAWSTISQAGYMLLFLGAGAYTAGILHLFTHALVKTGLFLAAGSVLYGLSSGSGGSGWGPGTVADLHQLGGLWKRFPITAAASLVAVLALGGAPWLAGSYSTNLGLAATLDYAHALQETSGNPLYLWLLFRVPALVTYLSALAIGRWWWLIFAGQPRNAKLHEQAHESAFLTLPVILLAGLSVGLWFEFSGILPLIAKSIPSILVAPGQPAMVVKTIDPNTNASYPQVIRDTGWAFLGLAAAAFLYLPGPQLMRRFRRLPGVGLAEYWLRHGMFFDELLDLFAALLLLLARATGFLTALSAAILHLLATVLALPLHVLSKMERPRRAAPAAPDAPTVPAESDAS